MIASAAARLRRRFRNRAGKAGRIVVLALALGLIGGAYATFAPTGQADETSSSLAVREGQKLYDKSCISCHGTNAQGVEDRGPSLIGVGSASVEFQVTSGRMPAARQEAQVQRKQPAYDDEQAKQLAAYIQSIGGGPEIPDGNLRGDEALGGELFRVNCSSCHAFSSNGGALSSGKYAPSLEPATDRQLYAAMLTGPQNMPVFGENQLTPEEKRAIIAYVQTQKTDADPGGWGIGRTGPVPEMVVIFAVGIVVCLFGALWIAGKS
ncbi:c-type cytochrome [Cryptosporangium aurantiacum]|uniref:Cytochrome bc1 complex cytochrome c subunit n=1 Tax=Cryptosporangium aurantiacum TaxID=134849 RepID=A0A1M7R7J1_9ACTN|nr:cytochrome c [Cryptosporangium aurantiacum]SHN42277.1 menaquinol-cytochrome c reductase cytochrome c1 subunit precursor [Cryptosporangium aurantiacum]